MLSTLAYVWPFTIDDAYIVSRFARNLREHRVWGMNRGVKGDGVTSPLFLLLVSWFCQIGAQPIVVQKTLGAAAFLLAQALGVRAWLRADAQSLWILCAAFTGFGFMWAVGGLETGLTGLVLTLSLPGTSRVQVRGAAFAGALMPWLRPELVPLVVVFRALEMRSRAEHATTTRAALRSFAPLVLSLVSVCVFRWLLFRDPLPIAVYAKQQDLSSGIRYALIGIFFGSPYLFFAWAYFRRPVAYCVLVAFGVAALSIALAGGDWMPGSRLFQPVFQAVFLWMGVLYGEKVNLRSRDPASIVQARNVPLALSWGLVTVIVAAALHERSAFTIDRAALAPLRARISQCEQVALVDVGYLVHDSDVRVVDLAGLTDKRIAILPGGHLDKRVALPTLRARGVDCVVLHGGTRSFPVEERLRAELVGAGVSVEADVALATEEGRYRYQLFVLSDTASNAPF